MHAINLSKMMPSERQQMVHTYAFFIHSCVRNAFGILLKAIQLSICQAVEIPI